MDTPLPLRERRRARLVDEIRHAAHRLFADRGFDAVTADDIAAAVGISKSTFFRHVPSKDALLIDPLLENISGIVAAFEARPDTENASEALIAATVENMTTAPTAEVNLWVAAIRSAPQLINRVTLVSPADRARLTKIAAQRMGIDDNPGVDPRPGLLVSVVLAASEYIFHNWITDPRRDRPPVVEQVETALRTVFTPQWSTHDG